MVRIIILIGARLKKLELQDNTQDNTQDGCFVGNIDVKYKHIEMER